MPIFGHVVAVAEVSRASVCIKVACVGGPMASGLLADFPLNPYTLTAASCT